MTRVEALEGLSSSSAHHRLKSARFFARNSDLPDLLILRRALRSEPDSYVRAALNQAIERASSSVPLAAETALDEIEIPPDVMTKVRKKVTEEITGMLLHELSSPLGLISANAAREIPKYDDSRTKRHVETFKRIFGAIEHLKCATAVPIPEEFDLAELLAEVVSEEIGSDQVEVSLHGVKPMLITSDRALLRLAVSNGIRNALEAVTSAPGDDAHPIVVTWGETDVDYWVAVLDHGPGLVGPMESAFYIGTTTKKGHSGFGLAVARQALETLGGACTIQPAKEGGTRFEVRWER